MRWDAELCADPSADVGAPVIDGVAAATLLVQSLVTLGLSGRTDGEFAQPSAKAYRGLTSGFAPSLS